MRRPYLFMKVRSFYREYENEYTPPRSAQDRGILLCAVCVFSLLPAQAFAAGVGQKASSWLGDQYVGSDGQHYYSPVPTNFLAYNSDGTTDKRSGSGGSAYRHYMLTDSDGVTHSVYCVESGIPYNTSEIPILRRTGPTAIT